MFEHDLQNQLAAAKPGTPVKVVLSDGHLHAAAFFGLMMGCKYAHTEDGENAAVLLEGESMIRAFHFSRVAMVSGMLQTPCPPKTLHCSST